MPRLSLPPSRTCLRLATGSLLATIALGLAAACGSSSSSSTGSDGVTSRPVGVYGNYDVSGSVASIGGIAGIDFDDGTHYTLSRTNGTEEYDLEQGTYVLDPGAGTLTLTDGDTGATETLPFVPGTESDGPPVTQAFGQLDLQGGASLSGPSKSLTSGDAGALTVQPLCGFTSGSSKFSSTSVPACKTSSGGAGLTTAHDGGVALATPGKCPPFVFQTYSSKASEIKIFATIKAVPDQATTAQYAVHFQKPPGSTRPVPAHPPAPTCFIDMNDLEDGLTGEKLTSSVKISQHYTLAQLVWAGTHDPFVYLDNQSVQDLETLIAKTGTVFPVSSGFRNPDHQSETCEHICGATSCCSVGGKNVPQQGNCQVTCASLSQHMFGTAFDLPAAYLKQPYLGDACPSGFTYVYNEANHLHIDTGHPLGCLHQGLP